MAIVLIVESLVISKISVACLEVEVPRERMLGVLPPNLLMQSLKLFVHVAVKAFIGLVIALRILPQLCRETNPGAFS